jgi:alkylation response protein AidB-like acyl-CoA dehydrogenase
VAEAKAAPERVDDSVRDDLAWIYSWLKCTELLNAATITQLGRGKMAVSETAMMKVAMARLLSRAGELGMRLEGPGAMLRRGNWQNHFMMAPAFHIAGGTDEIQRNLCAERVLGLPAEPRGDRDVPFEDLPRG